MGTISVGTRPQRHPADILTHATPPPLRGLADGGGTVLSPGERSSGLWRLAPPICAAQLPVAYPYVSSSRYSVSLKPASVFSLNKSLMDASGKD